MAYEYNKPHIKKIGCIKNPRKRLLSAHKILLGIETERVSSGMNEYLYMGEGGSFVSKISLKSLQP